MSLTTKFNRTAVHIERVAGRLGGLNLLRLDFYGSQDMAVYQNVVYKPLSFAVRPDACSNERSLSMISQSHDNNLHTYLHQSVKSVSVHY